MRWLHFYLRFVAAASLLLIVAGGLVTSTGSGLAVPDWPNTYGTFMFAFPLSKMVGGIFYEHGHRLIASIVGLLTIGLAVWLARIEPRRWVRRLGVDRARRRRRARAARRHYCPVLPACSHLHQPRGDWRRSSSHSS